VRRRAAAAVHLELHCTLLRRPAAPAVWATGPRLRYALLYS